MQEIFHESVRITNASSRTANFDSIALVVMLRCWADARNHRRRKRLTISGIPDRFASAEQIEENFRGRSFILGDNAGVALVRPVDSAKDAWLKRRTGSASI